MSKLIDVENALEFLKKWNNRFLQNNLAQKNDYSEIRETFKNWQNPFAAVLCCSDSRVAPEIFFDQKLGDIFVIRNAWNVVDEDVLWSIEYATEHLWVTLVVVVWHTNCWAVTTACKWWEFSSNIASIVKTIYPCVKDDKTVDEVSILHAKSMAKLIKDNEIVKSLKTKVIPACYDVVTWEVKWL